MSDHEEVLRTELRVIRLMKGNLEKLPDHAARMRVTDYITQGVIDAGPGEFVQVADSVVEDCDD